MPTCVVVEDGGDVLGREAVGGVADEHARLAHRAVPNHHALDVVRLGRAQSVAPVHPGKDVDFLKFMMKHAETSRNRIGFIIFYEVQLR